MTRLEELTRLAQAGNREAFGEIVQLLEGEVMHFAFRLQADRGRAEDIAQEAFVEAFRRLSFLADPAQLRAWIRGIVRNLHRARRRIEAREPAAIDVSSADFEHLGLAGGEGTSDDFFAGMSASEVFEILAAEIDRLPEHYRAAILLRHFEKLSCRAVSRRLGVPVGTVTMRLTRGHRLLREALARHSRRVWRA